MLPVALACALLVAVTTLFHYEVLRALNGGVRRLRIRDRTKLLVAVYGVLIAHGIEAAGYGAAYFVLPRITGVGGLAAGADASFMTCLYFSAETYTSLGFGDVAPVGPLRLLAGAEALNGLLLIAWSASFLYLAMERFWNEREPIER